jgi:glucose/arabinose dehydrogenase
MQPVNSGIIFAAFALSCKMYFSGTIKTYQTMNKCLHITTLLLIFFMNRSAAQAPTLSLTPVIQGLAAPMQLVTAGDGSERIFIIQKGGAINVYNKAYTLLGTFLTVTGITSTGERGLLSMAFHPDYANNGFFYVYYTNSIGSLEIARYKVSNNNPNMADAASREIVITIPHPTNTNHNGGVLRFGTDGYLYLSTGDGGGGGDVPNNAQNTSVLLGKILRLAVNTSATAPFYTVPAGNPFGNEVFAYGLRNPFRWSFDRETHDMWIGDVGQDSFEEINRRPSDSVNGTNFGWRCYEGDNTFNPGGCGNISNYIFPVYNYATPNPSGSVTGGSVYRGDTYIALRGYYISCDYYTGNFFIIYYDSTAHTYTTTIQAVTPVGMSNFDETEDGELYAVCLNNGTVYRINASGAKQYTFNGNGNWNVAGNWSNNSIPPATLPAGSIIMINPPANAECILNVSQTVQPGGKVVVSDNKRFRILGNLDIQ